MNLRLQYGFFNYFWIRPVPTMTENIKQMFSKMSDETRQEALECLMTEFNQDSTKLIRKNWIIGGRIPEDNQERIVRIFQHLLRTQLYRLNEIKVNL